MMEGLIDNIEGIAIPSIYLILDVNTALRSTHSIPDRLLLHFNSVHLLAPLILVSGYVFHHSLSSAQDFMFLRTFQAGAQAVHNSHEEHDDKEIPTFFLHFIRSQ